MVLLTAVHYAILSAVTVAGFWLYSRAFLKGQEHSDLFAFLMQALTIPVWVPLLFFETPRVSANGLGWALLLLAGLLWSVQQVLVFKSIQRVSASIRAPIHQSKLVWASLAGFLFLGETFTWNKAAGIGLLAMAGVFLSRQKSASEVAPGGIGLVLSSALASGLAYAADKAALFHFSPTLYAILVTLVVSVFLGADLAARNRFRALSSYLRSHAKPLSVCALLGGISYWFLVKALSEGDVSLVAPLLELDLVFTVTGGVALLHERQNAGEKLVAVALALAGAWLIL